MVSLSQAKQQIQEQRHKLVEQRQKISEAEFKIAKAKSSLPKVESQRYLRGQQGKEGLIGKKLRVQVISAKGKLTSKEKELGKAKEELTTFETEKLIPFEKKVKEAEAKQRKLNQERRMYKIARKFAMKGIFPYGLKGKYLEYYKKVKRGLELQNKKFKEVEVQGSIGYDDLGQPMSIAPEYQDKKSNFLSIIQLPKNNQAKIESLMRNVTPNINVELNKSFWTKTKNFLVNFTSPKREKIEQLNFSGTKLALVEAQPTKSTIQTNPLTGEQTFGKVLIKDYNKITPSEALIQMPLRSVRKARDIVAESLGKGVEKGLTKLNIESLYTPSYYGEQIGEVLKQPVLIKERLSRLFKKNENKAIVKNGVLTLTNAKPDYEFMSKKETKRLESDKVWTKKEIAKGTEAGAKFGSYFLPYGLGELIFVSDISHDISKEGGIKQYIKKKPIEAGLVGGLTFLGLGSYGKKILKIPIIKELDEGALKLTTRWDEFFGKVISIGEKEKKVKILPSERGLFLERKKVRPKTESMDEIFIMNKHPTKSETIEDLSINLFEDVKGYSVQTKEGSIPVVKWIEKKPLAKKVERKIEIKSPFTKKGKEAREFALEKLTSFGMSKEEAKSFLRVTQPKVIKTIFKGNVLTLEKGKAFLSLAQGERRSKPLVEYIEGVKTRGGRGEGQVVRGFAQPLKLSKDIGEDVTLSFGLSKEQKTLLSKEGYLFNILEKKPKTLTIKKVTVSKKTKEAELPSLLFGDTRITKIRKKDIQFFEDSNLKLPKEFSIKEKSKSEFSLNPIEQKQKVEVFEDVTISKIERSRRKTADRGVVLIRGKTKTEKAKEAVGFSGKQTQKTKLAGEQEASALLSLPKLKIDTAIKKTAKLDLVKSKQQPSLLSKKTAKLTGAVFSVKQIAKETSISSPFQVSGSKQQSKLETRQKSESMIKPMTISKTRAIPLTLTKIKGIIKTEQEQDIKSQLGQLSESKPQISTKSILSAIIKQRQSTGQQPAIRTPPIPSKKIKPKISIYKPQKPTKEKAKEVLNMFKLFVRKGGKDIQIGKATTEEEAFNLLKKRLKLTLRASGFVTKSGKKVKPFKYLRDIEFRTSKESPFRIVEKKSKRLRKGTTGKEIQFFKKIRRKKNSLF